MALHALFSGATRKHAARTLLRCRSAFAMSVQEPRPKAAGRGSICLRAVGVQYTPLAVGIWFCAVADIQPRHSFSGSTDQRTNRNRHPPCPQFAHQQRSSGTVSPMFVFARAGFTRPDAEATPAPIAGAAKDEAGAAGFNCPLGVMPSAPFSS